MDNNLNKNHYDFGIVGFWYGINYGSILTYYALYKTIEDCGYRCLLINKHTNLWDERFYDKKSLANRFFISEKFNRSRVRKDSKDWFDLNNYCDAFVVGSDIVWKYTLPPRVGYHFFLDFAEDNKKKIAYAPSFGGDWLGKEQSTRKAKYYLERFDYISCRENEGAEILSNTFGVSGKQVMDPVFLVPRETYDELTYKSKKTLPESYICSYILGPGKEKRSLLLLLQKICGNIDLINIVNAANEEKGSDLLNLKTETNLSVYDWLNYIKNCKIYIGDSFHGICYSIIFRKNFILVRNRVSPSRCRFDTLLALCGLENRSIYADEDISERPDLLEDIDYNAVYERLTPLINDSREWLKNALSSEKENACTSTDIILEQLYALKAENEALKKRLEELEARQQG